MFQKVDTTRPRIDSGLSSASEMAPHDSSVSAGSASWRIFGRKNFLEWNGMKSIASTRKHIANTAQVNPVIKHYIKSSGHSLKVKILKYISIAAILHYGQIHLLLKLLSQVLGYATKKYLEVDSSNVNICPANNPLLGVYSETQSVSLFVFIIKSFPFIIATSALLLLLISRVMLPFLDCALENDLQRSLLRHAVDYPFEGRVRSKIELNEEASHCRSVLNAFWRSFFLLILATACSFSIRSPMFLFSAAAVILELYSLIFIHSLDNNARDSLRNRNKKENMKIYDIRFCCTLS